MFSKSIDIDEGVLKLDLKEIPKTKALFGLKKMVTHHSVFITHHLSLSLKTPHLVWHHHSIFFNYLWAPYLYLVQLLLFFFSFNPQYPNSPNPVRKKKKLKTKLTEPKKKNPEPSERRREKRRRRRNN